MARFDVSVLLLGLLLAGGAPARAAGEGVPRLVPLPRAMVVLPGHFSVSAATPVVAPGAAHGAALRFIELLRRTAGIAPRLRAAAAGHAIRFRMVPGMAPEAYRLEVGEAGATISASDDAGLFYGGRHPLAVADRRAAAAPRPAQRCGSADRGRAALRLARADARQRPPFPVAGLHPPADRLDGGRTS